ncbi:MULTISPECIES: arginine--tRNA ligase [unclassified Mycoplasma]|uniref:arginine--tRNA ligase n=1 Tax=unclassified Mycoplasma TaxID=2683645 RepID=UPI00211C1600|nr:MULTISPECIES: arginine--tRNA ligase [unclassified Mycoplasma]UUM19571.1 arginine--tRNA ligase [Mycoplasma sp. 1578d]UUM24490.1 arginine--tRNA ligase [Mycoplasma sp. 3686d]
MSLFLEIKEKINNVLAQLKEQKVLSDQLQINSLNYNLSTPNVPDDLNSQGTNYHFATNVAFITKKYFNESPLTLANVIQTQLQNDPFFAQIDVAKPGFINLVINDQQLIKKVEQIAQLNENYGKNQVASEKINLEFVSANPTGFLHVGHARGAAVGDSLARILTHAGHHVEKEYYINDAGNQINILTESTSVRYHDLFGIKMQFPETSYRGEDIVWLANKIKEKYNDKFIDKTDTKEFKQICINILLNKIKSDLANFNVTFDTFFSEQSLYDQNAIEVVLDNLKQHTYTKDRALFLQTEKFGDDKDRVLIKQDGTYTYLLPDIAYHLIKANKAQKLLNVWGADHSGYINRMKIALTCLGYSQDKVEILVVQLVRLLKNGQEYKMSKRAGTSVFLSDLLAESSTDAVRFSMLSREVNSKFDFDINLSNQKDQKNPVFIVQYAHSRAFALLNKLTLNDINYHFITSEKLQKLILELDKFPELIKTIANTLKVNLMVQYLIDLAKAFNSFYSESKIIGSENQNTLAYVVLATKNTLKLGLNLIGVSAPNKM